MLLRGLTWLVLFQLIGTALNVLILPMLPGPIIGMLLMFAFLRIRGEVGQPISEAATALLRYLPLLLVPPAVGVMVYTRQIAADFWDSPSPKLLGVYTKRIYSGGVWVQ